MRLAHLADLHCDFRAYQRTDARGRNQRQMDAHQAFECAVGQILTARPDVVAIAGDVFHRPLPYSESLQFAFRQVRRLTTAGIPVVAISGNHETPKQRDMGCPLSLLEEAGAVVVVRQSRTVRIGELAIGCLPSAALSADDWPVRDPDARLNVLLAHGGFTGIWPYAARPDGNIPAEAFEGWDYVALGDYHVAHQVAPNAYYAGALDYVTTNPWAELEAERALGRPGVKCWLLVELGDHDTSGGGSSRAGGIPHTGTATGALLGPRPEDPNVLAVAGNEASPGVRCDPDWRNQTEAPVDFSPPVHVGAREWAHPAGPPRVPSLRQSAMCTPEPPIPGHSTGQHAGRHEEGAAQSEYAEDRQRAPSPTQSVGGPSTLARPSESPESEVRILPECRRPALKVTLIPIPLARRVIELPAIDAAGCEVDAVNTQLAQQAQDIEGQIVKQPLLNVTKALSHALDYHLVRRLKSKALHYHLAIQRADEAVVIDNILFDHTGRRKSLAEMVTDRLLQSKLPPEELERLVALGQKYLSEADQSEEKVTETVAGAAA